MNYKETIDWLYSLQTFGIKLGLENMRRLARAMDLPGPGQRILHVAGTNGKGSVCAMMESIGRAAGWKTGLFTSPHLIHYRERIRANGEMISEERVVAIAEGMRERVAGWDPHPTFFEVTLAMALQHFRDEGAEAVVLETGMGGRLDATNALRTDLSVIAPIGFDHQKWLGDTLAEIAGEKAGILRKGVPSVSAVQRPEAAAVLERVAPDIAFVEEEWTSGPVALPGRHQRRNAALAAEAMRRSGLPISEKAIGEGLAGVRWRARFERIGRFVVDGAHNVQGVEAFAETWREAFGERRAVLIFGSVEGKDIEGMLHALIPIARHFVCTKTNSPRGSDPSLIAALLSGQTSCELAEGASEALEKVERRDGLVAVVGSLFLAGEFLTLLEEAANAFEPSTQ